MKAPVKTALIGILMSVSSNCSAQNLDAGNLTKILEKLLAGQLKGKMASQAADVSGQLGQLGQLTSILTKGAMGNLIKFDEKNSTIAFSPVFMKMAAIMAKQHLTSLKQFDLTPMDDRMAFAIEFAGGSKMAMEFMPQFIELDVKEFAIVGVVPGGIKLEQSKEALNGLSGYLDAFLGVSERVGKLMKNLTIEGDTIRLTRPYSASVLGRAMKPEADGQTASSAAGLLPFKIEHGWLKLSLPANSQKSDVWQIVLNMLLARFKQ